MSICYFCGGRVVLPESVANDLSVGVEGERIVSLLPRADLPADAEVIDLDGAYLLPGFVDIHVHGGGGADFMDNTKHHHCRNTFFKSCVSVFICSLEKLVSNF